MAAIASFSVAHENGQYQYTLKPRKPIYTRFQGNNEKKWSQRKKKFSHQVAAILIIDVKLKI